MSWSRSNHHKLDNTQAKSPSVLKLSTVLSRLPQDNFAASAKQQWCNLRVEQETIFFMPLTPDYMRHLVLNKDLDYISQESTPRTHRTLSGAIMMLGKKTITYWKRLNKILAEWNIGGLIISLLGFLLRDWRDLQLSFALFSLVTKLSYQDFFILKLKFNIKFKILI